MSDSPGCKHCGSQRKRQCRGLCYSCYYTPEIRNQYPRLTVKTFNPGEVKEGNFTGELPPEPTMAVVGSEERIKVMAERAKAGQLLHHPDDYKRD